MSRVEARYPLTPMQQGMLFHSLSSPAADVYFGQAHWSLHTDLDIPAFHRAWQEVTSRHAALRSSFDWSRPEQPQQVVHRQVDVPLHAQDWRMLPRRQQEERLEEFLYQDRAHGFALDAVPLLRLNVFRLADDEYRIVWSGHHLLVDGRSMAIVLREVLALYEEFHSGTPAHLPAPSPYEDFVGRLRRQDRAAAHSFWHAQLRGIAGPTTISPAPSRRGRVSAAEVREMAVAKPLLQRLFAAARAADSSLNTMFMGAWAILLSRYVGQNDVVYGVTVGSGGADAPLRRAQVGLFINTLPLRVLVCPEDSLPAFLHALRTRLLGLQRFAHTPLVDIQRWSGLPAAIPLFDTIVVCDNSAIDRLPQQYAGLRLSSLQVVQHSSFPLNLVVRRAAELRLRLIWDEQYIPGSDVSHLASQLESLLDAIARHPQGHIQDVAPLPNLERRRLPRRTAAVGSPLPSGIPIRLFEEHVRRNPGAPAVAAGTERLTYDQLNRQANRLAHLLAARGIGPEDVVGMAVRRSPGLVVALAGIAKVGAASLLLDPDAPAERLTFMRTDARAQIVVTTSDLAERVGGPASLVLLDRDLPRAADDSNPAVPASAHHLAHVVYTSGSSGEPKGVLVEQGGLVNLVAWHREAFRVVPGDRATQLAHPAFDALLWEVWPYLAAGASIHIPPDEVRAAPPKLRDWLCARRITMCFLPTPLGESVLTLAWPASTAVRAMLLGGDVLHSSPAPTVPFAVFNNYGPTECTVVATSGRVLPGQGTVPTIGRPIAHVEVHVLDESLQPAATGAPGEIWIGGAGVTRGYLDRPQLTAQRFRPRPAGLPGQGVLYRTGDLGRYRADGEIEFLGRIDHQVKIRGYRIELGEIEAALGRHPGVRQVVVVAQEDGKGGKALVAYMIPVEGVPPTAELRGFLRRNLPEYMIPSVYMPLTTLPLTAAGKVDVRRLPALSTGARDVAKPPPRTAEEKALAGVWRAVLRVDGIGLDDDFFELGGDSLRAVELVERLRARLGYELVPSDLFRAPTIAEQLRLCHRGVHCGPGVLVPVRPHGRQAPFFCAAPILGTVFPYFELARLLGDDQPFYGLQPQGVTGGASTIEHIAAAYLAALCEVQPRGPYYLGGWSFGGLVAFEMARQLSSQGEQVGLLAIIDTPAPVSRGRARLSDALRFVLRTLLRGVWGYAADYLYLTTRSSGRGRQEHAPLLSQPLSPRFISPLGSVLGRSTLAAMVLPEPWLLLHHPPTIRQMLRSLHTGIAASLRYRPQRYSGPITLLRAAESLPWREATPALGWETLSASVHVHYTAGDHMTALRAPHVSSLARALQAALEESRQAR